MVQKSMVEEEAQMHGVGQLCHQPEELDLYKLKTRKIRDKKRV